MTLYFEFEEQRRKAEVNWPHDRGSIDVQLTDYELIKKFPVDLIFDVNGRNKVSYTIENPDNKKLVQLQKIICKRLQEFANQLIVFILPLSILEQLLKGMKRRE
jgi:hypothetical protein